MSTDAPPSTTAAQAALELLFRPLPAGGAAEPDEGDLVLRPRSADPAAERKLALLALDKGPGAFAQGPGTARRIVIQADPTLDDMLATTFLNQQLACQTPPPGARAFALYAANVREGLRPGKLPPEESLAGLFQACRYDAGGNLTHAEAGARFLAEWALLEKRIVQAAGAGLDPATASLFADAPEFERARLFLSADRQVFYEQDVPRGERWLVHIPGGPREAAGLLLPTPKSALWKYWARQDPKAAGGSGNLFLAVYEQPQHWRFSTDPLRRVEIRSLADRLQDAELKANPRHPAEDPWYDGARFGYTLVGAPRAGTALSDEQVLAVVRRWAKVRVVEADRVSRVPYWLWLKPSWRKAAAVAACVAAVLLAWAVLRHRAEAPADPLAATVNGELVARARTLGDARTELFEWELPTVQMRHGANEVILPADNPDRPDRHVKLHVLVEGDTPLPIKWLKVHVNDDQEPRKAVEPDGTKNAVDSGYFEADLRQGVNYVRVTFYNPGEGGLPVKVRAGWQEARRGAGNTLYLLAVGISTYRPEAKLEHLDCPVRDAEALKEAFERQAGPGRLFKRVVPLVLLDGRATKGGILKALGGLRDQRPRRGDLVIVVLAGHGEVDSLGNFYFLPYNFTAPPGATETDTDVALGDGGLPWAEVEKFFSKMACPVVVLADTCHSGAIKVATRGEADRGKLEQAVTNAVAKLQNCPQGVAVMAACLSKQVAYETTKWKHGALSLAALEVLEGKYETPLPSDVPLPSKKGGYVVTLEDLRRYAEDRVRELAGRRQEPVLVPSNLYPSSVPLAVVSR
jgi:hypothetical protein